MAMNYVSLVLIWQNPQGWLTSNETQAYILMYFQPTYRPPMCDQADPMQLGQPTLCTEVKAYSLSSYMNNSPQHSRKVSVPEQVGLTG